MHELPPHAPVGHARPPGLPPAAAPQCRCRRLSCPLERPSPGGIQRRPWLHLSPPSRLPKPSAPDLPRPRRPTLAGSGWSFPTSAMGKRSGRRGLVFFWRIGCVCGGGDATLYTKCHFGSKEAQSVAPEGGPTWASPFIYFILRAHKDGPVHGDGRVCART